MKKKTLNIVLIFLIIIIWGGVLHKFFPGEKQPDTSPSQIYAGNVAIKINRKDSIDLKITNDQPFGIKKTKMVRKDPVTINRSPNTMRKAQVKTDLPWPLITYHGFVQNEHSKHKLILLKIDGDLVRLKENESFKEMVITKANKDSIVIRRNNQKKIIKKM